MVLELGGNAPVIVFDDVDIDSTLETLIVAGYYNAGQECTAGARVMVRATFSPGSGTLIRYRPTKAGSKGET